MRNLKRALSLALASVMLLGMMVVGSSAAFTDAASIENKEAVELMNGLGVMVGYEDGSFGPEGTVTRAEAAVVIDKILHGTDIDPTIFTGTGKFTDVPAWAEGWVNLAASMNIIVGYGDGKFGPSDKVTTVQFATMLLKALGYYTYEGALGADWQLEVTSKATALGLYGDMVLSMNAPLSREDMAEMTMNALWAQRVAYDDYRGLYVKNSDRNVVVTNGTVDVDNTLAANTFGLYAVEGIVVANGMTDEVLSASLKSEEQTTVLFTEDTDLDQDGKAEIDANDEYDFEYETGLDMIGHAVKVYYTIEKKEPVVLAMVDEATLVAELTWNKNTTKLAAAANDAGFKKNTILNVEIENYIVNYDMDVEYNETFTLDKIIVISNSANKEVDYVIALDQYLSSVYAIEMTKDVIDEIELTFGEAKDMTVVTYEAEEDDLVIVTDIGNESKVLIVEPATVIEAEISKVVGISNDNAEVKQVVADGETYTKSTVTYNEVDDTVEFAEIATIGEATLVLDKDGKLIALAKAPAAAPDYAYVAQYGVQHSTGTLNTTNVLTAHVYFADGTNGIYTVDVKNSNALSKAKFDANAEGYKAELNKGGNFDNGKGLFDVSIKSNGKIEIDLLKTDVSGSKATAEGTKLVKAHSTFVDGKTYVAYDFTVDTVVYKNNKLLNNNDTLFFYVNGSYAKDDLTVDVITGIKNVKGFTNAADKGIVEAFATYSARTDRAVVKAVGIDGVSLASGVSGVYYYDQGNYYVTKVDGKYELTYVLYNEKGEKVEATYAGYADAVDAKDDAKNLPDGFYKIGAKELTPHVTMNKFDGSSTYSKWTAVYGQDKDVQYVVNAFVEYDEYVDNLFDQINVVGAISDDTKVIDICNSGLNTLKKIANAIDKDGNVTISYAWENKDDYAASIIFVTAYDPDKTEKPGTSASVNKGIEKVELKDGKATVTLKSDATKTTKYTVELQVYSIDQLAWGKVASKVIEIEAGEKTGSYTFTGLETNKMYRAVVDGVASEM